MPSPSPLPALLLSAALASPGFPATGGSGSHAGYAPGITPEGAGDRFFPSPAKVDSARLLLPGDLRYMGAFRLPRDKGGSEHGFTYLVGAMTYYPKGDPAGAKDGYPGSLFVAGHSSDNWVAEISIPAPAKGREWKRLPGSEMLRPFKELGVHPGGQGITVAAVEYLPPATPGGKERIHATLGDGYLPKEGMKSYVSADMDFGNRTQPKAFVPDKVHCYNDYLFAIPKDWADRYAPGMRLAGGRHREGDLCGQGPALYVMDPDADSASPVIRTKAILRYKDKGGALHSYSHGGDVFYAGTWATAGAKSAVLFSGRKGLGQGIYGTYCKVQGFHDLKGYLPYIIFYDPAELGQVALGKLAPHAPQPYAALDVNDLLLVPNTDPCHRQHLNAFAFDAVHRVLFATEKSRGEQPVVHVWKL